MASKKVIRSKKFLQATLVTGEKGPCAFCRRQIDDELMYGKLYEIGGLQCHYFCVLLSCCLVQRTRDTEGLFGFVYPDIVAELERSKKHRCSYCGSGGANLGCSVSQCRKQFHLPCGREKNAVSLFYGNYKSYCQQHAPKQKIPPHIMELAKQRMKKAKTALREPGNFGNLKELSAVGSCDEATSGTESVCVICYEAVEGFPTVNTFWPLCCARDAWFHRTCLQRMALSAGMHYLKCPLCNDKDTFYKAVVDQGYYVPDRDAAWELEQNAFAEIYERPLSCSAERCLCPSGRDHDAESGPWDITLCILCGTMGSHVACIGEGRFVCAVCRPAAPTDLDSLARQLDTVMRAEQARLRERSQRRVMPCRMSLRRTKPAINCDKSSLHRINSENYSKNDFKESNTALSRLELNLKTPTKLPGNQPLSINVKNIENICSYEDTNTIFYKKTSPFKNYSTKISPYKSAKSPFKTYMKSPNKYGIILKYNNIKYSPNKRVCNMMSPSKILDNINVKMDNLGVERVDSGVEDKLKSRLKKPRPLSEKKRIVNDILADLFDNIMQDVSDEHNSPNKTDASTIINEATLNTEDASPTAAENQILRTPEKLNQNLPLVEKMAILPGAEENLPLVEKVPMLSKAEKENMPLVEKVSMLPGAEKENLPLVVKEENLDDSSNSTFQLPSEFIADKSDDSMSLFETPKKTKTVEIEKDSSLEISKNDEVVNIDMVKMEYMPYDQNVMVKIPLANIWDVIISSPNKALEEFKNRCLNDSDGDFKSNLNGPGVEDRNSDCKSETAIDLAKKVSVNENLKTEPTEKHRKKKPTSKSRKKHNERRIKTNKNTGVKHTESKKENDRTLNKKYQENNDTDKNTKTSEKGDKRKKLKRKLDNKDGVPIKKRKKDKQSRSSSSLVLNYKENRSNIEVVCSDTKNTESIDLTVENKGKDSVTRKKNKKIKKGARENIHVKIRFKKEKLRLQITKSKLETKKGRKKILSLKSPALKQYVLQYSSSSPNKVITKPENPINPKKRTYVKLEKSPDNLKQTSIQSFFKKVTTPVKNE